MRLTPDVCVPRSLLVFAITVLSIAAVAAPASAATLSVCASGCDYSDLQLALEAAQPGDVIMLRGGETFVGNFVLPTKPGGSSASIVIRSDAADSAFPAAGTRLVPPGYPGSNVASNVLARLRGRGGVWKTTPVVQAAPGAHHFRLQFLDIDGIAQLGWETIVELGNISPQQNALALVPYAIVLDRVFVHGHPTKAQKRCVSLNGRDLSVLNSYITGCASFDVDAQAIAGFNGPGPFRIINNYLEASTENIMFGGADPAIADLIPSDIEIRRNHFFKPATWRNPILAPPSAAPSASVVAGGGALPAGTHYFIIVAVLESAGESAVSAPSAERAVSVPGASAVTLTWNAVAGADRYRVYRGTSAKAQSRYLETTGAVTSMTYRASGEIAGSPRATGTRWNVKNHLELKNAQRVLIDGNVFDQIWAASQTGYAILLTPRNADGGSPWSLVRDVTISNNILRHAAGGIVILGDDDERGSPRTGRITIRNNLVYDLSHAWGGSSHFLLTTRSPFDVKVDHNTIFHEGMVILADDGGSEGFEFTNNLAPHNEYGIFGSGVGFGTSALAAYFPGAIVRRNALGDGPAALYPPDNLFPDMSVFAAQFVNAAGRDYRLAPDSVFRGAGTDGRDLGVDIAALDAAVRGVAEPAVGGDAGTAPIVVGPSRSTPHGGSAVSLPGIIQAENFDGGASGIAYLDTTGGNLGGEYRSTDVDIQSTQDAGGGYNLGWVRAGEWVNYTVTVAASGTYTIDVRVAAPGAGGTFHLEVDGVDKTGPMTVPNTGGWQTWTSITKSGVSFNSGAQVWRLVIDNAGASGVVGNINYIRVTAATAAPVGGSTPFGGTPVALPGVIQAEDFDLGGEGVSRFDTTAGNQGGQYRATNVDISISGDGGGGYNLGWIAAREWLNYTVNVTAAGIYDLEARVASNGGGGTFHIEMNGIDRTGPIAVPDTGGWQTWATVRRTGVTLAAGTQVWRLVMDTDGSTGAVGNINYVRVVASGASASGRDIVLYSSDVTTIAGDWARQGSTTGANGQRMHSNDAGWVKTDQPAAAPSNYFEARFVPEVNRPYRLWLRLRATGDSKHNDSVWVQFSGAVSISGAPLWRTGTTSALLVNLEACPDCGVASWGWQNGAWWLNDTAVVRFTSGATQTIRVQTREDGVEIDQIVLSPLTYFNVSPGSQSEDATIVPKR